MSTINKQSLEKYSAADADRYLNVAEVAARYNASIQSVWRWAREGTIPSQVKIGPGCTRWRLSDLAKFESDL